MKMVNAILLICIKIRSCGDMEVLNVNFPTCALMGRKCSHTKAANVLHDRHILHHTFSIL